MVLPWGGLAGGGWGGEPTPPGAPTVKAKALLGSETVRAGQR
ncbi:hypothetical protein AB0395_29895 [Streptosporangium sp. NPDC051023]